MSGMPIIGFIGIGKVGETIARLADSHGYEVGAIYNRSVEKSERLAAKIDTTIASDVQTVVQSSDLIVLTVNDDAVLTIAETLADCEWLNKALTHVSGSLSIDVLQAVYKQGGMVGSLHPAFPFSDVESAIHGIDGSTFAIEYSDETLGHWLIDLIQSFGGHIIEVPRGAKAQYHLALAILSNYTVTLYAVAQDLLRDISPDTIAIKSLLNTLLIASVNNIAQQDIPGALTGPLVRSDLKTIDSHLNVLRDDMLLQETYINLARLSYPMLAKRDIDITQLDNFFKDNWNASDNS